MVFVSTLVSMSDLPWQGNDHELEFPSLSFDSLYLGDIFAINSIQKGNDEHTS